MHFGQDVFTFSFQFDGLRGQEFLVPLSVWKSTYGMIGSTRVRSPALLLKVACTSSGKTRNCSSTCIAEWGLSAKYLLVCQFEKCNLGGKPLRVIFTNFLVESNMESVEPGVTLRVCLTERNERQYHAERYHMQHPMML